MFAHSPSGDRFRCAASALFVAVAIGASAAPAVAQQPASTVAQLPASAVQITPANAPAQLPPGYAKSGNDYVYDGGQVIVTPALATAGLPCTNGYVCLYRDVNWLGTRWQFASHNWQNLNPYGASDQVSSWSNHESRTAYLGWNSIAQGIGSTIALDAGAHASSMGSWNDNASSVLP